MQKSLVFIFYKPLKKTGDTNDNKL